MITLYMIDKKIITGCADGGTEGLDSDGLPHVGKLLKEGHPLYRYLFFVLYCFVTIGSILINININIFRP